MRKGEWDVLCRVKNVVKPPRMGRLVFACGRLPLQAAPGMGAVSVSGSVKRTDWRSALLHVSSDAPVVGTFHSALAFPDVAV